MCHRFAKIFFVHERVHETGGAGVPQLTRLTMPRTIRLFALLTIAALGCGDYTRCEEPDPKRLAPLPALLSETGLYADAAREVLADGVLRYRPLAELWSDGAEKERFIRLPPDALIDTRDMDNWRFPAGTKLWKTFIRDGVRVETRILHKLDASPDSWTAAAYVYLEDGSDAQLTAAGAEDVLGTEHDVPAASQCPACHRGRESFVLGFSAIQLAHELELLVEQDLLSDPPARAPHLPGSATERAARAYLHANCGHCHNSARPPQGAERCYDPENDLDFWLRVDGLGSAQTTPTQAMIRRMSRRGGGQMPPLATELVDERAVALLRRWLDER